MNLKNFAKRFILIFVALALLTFGSCSVYAEGEEMEFYINMALANYQYSTFLLNKVDRALVMQTGEDGNLLKKEKLTKEEQSVYDEIRKVVDELVKLADSDNSILSADVKKTKAIYNWINENISYDEKSLHPSSSFDFSKGVEGEVISINPNRREQSALNAYKDKTAVCAGKTLLFELMMKMAGLSCVCVGNFTHAFNAAWLDRGDGEPCWMFVDPTETGDDPLSQFSKAIFEPGQSFDKPFKYDSKACNEGFIVLGFGIHFVCDIYSSMDSSIPNMVTIDNPDGSAIYCRRSASRAGAIYDKKSSDSQVFALPKDLVCLSKRWKLSGDFKTIENLDAFVQKGIQLDICETSFCQTVEKDGVLFEIYGGGFEAQKDSEGKTICHDKKPVYPKTTLRIKPKSGVFVSEVSIPQELEIFLGDVDKIQVESESIKTVKYSLLPRCESLKEGVELPDSVKFEKVVKPS